MEEDKINNLDGIEKFFEYDMNIKQEMIKIAPNALDDVDEASRIEYVDKLSNKLKDLEVETLISIQKLKLGSNVNNVIKTKFENIKDKLLIGHYTKGIPLQLYNSMISNMKEEFVQSVKEKCRGYTLSDSDRLEEVINQATTVNEILHAMHSYIINNEKILQSMPKISEKQNIIGENIILYGKQNEIGEKIYKEFPLALDCDAVDIVSLNEKVLMMVRSRGHALTFDIDTMEEENIEIRYFVPKLCNRKMIEALPGVNKSGITQSGATGFFISSKEGISKDLYDFIEKVPTDLDIEMNKKNYKEQQKEENKEQTQEKKFFDTKSIQELVYENGTEGRKLSKVEQTKNKIYMAIQKMRKQKNNKER